MKNSLATAYAMRRSSKKMKAGGMVEDEIEVGPEAQLGSLDTGPMKADTSGSESMSKAIKGVGERASPKNAMSAAPMMLAKGGQIKGTKSADTLALINAIKANRLSALKGSDMLPSYAEGGSVFERDIPDDVRAGRIRSALSKVGHFLTHGPDAESYPKVFNRSPAPKHIETVSEPEKSYGPETEAQATVHTEADESPDFEVHSEPDETPPDAREQAILDRPGRNRSAIANLKEAPLSKLKSNALHSQNRYDVSRLIPDQEEAALQKRVSGREAERKSLGYAKGGNVDLDYAYRPDLKHMEKMDTPVESEISPVDLLVGGGVLAGRKAISSAVSSALAGMARTIRAGRGVGFGDETPPDGGGGATLGSRLSKQDKPVSGSRSIDLEKYMVKNPPKSSSAGVVAAHDDDAYADGGDVEESEKDRRKGMIHKIMSGMHSRHYGK